jgi:putative transposase
LNKKLIHHELKKLFRDSVEEALIEMYLAGVSVCRVEDITQVLWGTKFSPGTISNLNQKACAHIETCLPRKLNGDYPYVYVEGGLPKA